MANKRNGNYWGQSFPLSLTNFRSISFSVPLKHSTKPFVCGWYTEVYKGWTPRKHQTSYRISLMKEVSGSVTTCLRIPTQVNTWANCHVIVSAFMLCSRMASG